MKILQNRTSIFKPFFLCSLLILIWSQYSTSLCAQTEVRLTVLSGNSTTTCDDFLSAPEPQWGVNVESQGWVTYPQNGACFQDPPNIQYSQMFDCPAQTSTLNVCFEAYEDDGFACLPSESCRENICMDFPVPNLGNTSVTHTLTLPAGGDSGGSVTFSIETVGDYLGGYNDQMCDALDLGMLSSGGLLGDASLTTYNNYCSDGIDEPNPADDGVGWNNNLSVWFTFTTGNDVSSVISVFGTSDPEGIGSAIGLQLAIYSSSDGTCNGNWILEAAQWDGSIIDDLDEFMIVNCLEPNTTYWLMVDGISTPGNFFGDFGLEVEDHEIDFTSDEICDAENMGSVPNGGSITTGMTQTNVCATSNNDPNVQNFTPDKSVWFTFNAPDSRHVIIDIISDQAHPDGVNQINAQVALFESGNGSCSGTLSELGSAHAPGTYDESLDINCLEPGETYFIMVDGGNTDHEGIFEVVVTDAGYDPIVTTLDTTICYGSSIIVNGNVYENTGPINENIITPEGCDSLVTGTLTILPENTTTQIISICAFEFVTVGTSTYTTSGNYSDVFTGGNGCDSIVFTNLTVAEELVADAVQTVEASAYQVPDGTATVNVTGGINSNYTYEWSNGATTATASNLLGGSTYCVTVTDMIGCSSEDCVLVLFPSNIQTTLNDYPLTCTGDSDGVLNLSISNGVVPYNYSWSNGNNSLNGNGVVNTEGGTATITALPAGNYSFTITDAFGVKVVDGNVIDPPEIISVISPVICFGESIQIGNATYNTAGPINETLISYLGCDSIVTGSLTILPQIVTTLNETVCFGGSITIGNTVYNSSGNLMETLTAVNGCDSLIEGTLTVLDEIHTLIDSTVCFGESIEIGSVVYNATGQISEILTAINGCDSLVTGVLIVKPEVTTTQSPVICAGESLTVGTSVYNTNGNFTDTLIGTDGCDSTVFTNLTVLPAISLTTSLITEATGYQDPDGVANIAAQGGEGNFSYLWSNGQTTQTAIGLMGGTEYCVTVSDGAGCTSQACILILFPSDIQTNISNVLLDCPGDNDGVLNLSVSNGAVPYTYQWSNANNTLNGSGTIDMEGGIALINNLSSGVYSFTITDAFGVTNTSAAVIDPEEIFTPIDATLCFGESLTVGNVVYNATGVVFENLSSWLGCDSIVGGFVTVLDEINTDVNETLCFGENLVIGSSIYNTTGPINETLTASNGCDSIVTGFLNILPEISTILDTTVCFGQVVNVGTATYNTSGNFIETLSASNGCDSIININLVVLDELNATASQQTEASGLGANDGTAFISSVGGSGNFTYEWSNGQITQQATELIGGETYCVTITDIVGCQKTDCITILFPVNIISTIENDTVDCVGSTSGILNFTASNGQAPYNYNWQNDDNTLNGSGTIALEGGMGTVTNLPSGNYTVTISDVWGSTIISGAVIDPLPIIVTIVNTQSASCFGNCDAGAVLSVSGGKSPYNFNWPDGQTTADVNDLCAGQYLVTITDANDCSNSLFVNVNEPPAFIATAVQEEPVSCFGSDNGQASVNTNGNPIAYLWDNGETTAVALNLDAGDHFVTVTNMDNCIDVTSVVINQPLDAMSIDIIEESSISCADANDGILLATVTDGNGLLNYNWSNGNNTAIANQLTVGNYTVTVSDANGCSSVATYSINGPSPIDLDLTTTDITCTGGDRSGVIQIDEVTGGVGPYLFSLDGATFIADSVFTNLKDGTYEVFVEDAVGCIKSFTISILPPPVLRVNLGGDETIVLGESIELEALSTSSNVIYNWTPAFEVECTDCPSIEVQPTITTVYTVGVIDTITLCTHTDQIQVFVTKDRNVYIPNVFSPNADGFNDFFFIESDISVEIISSLQIFNRWGAKIFERQNLTPGNINQGWNGVFNGKYVDPGVYIFKAEVLFKDGEKKIYTGDITVMN